MRGYNTGESTEIQKDALKRARKIDSHYTYHCPLPQAWVAQDGERIPSPWEKEWSAHVYWKPRPGPPLHQQISWGLRWLPAGSCKPRPFAHQGVCQLQWPQEAPVIHLTPMASSCQWTPANPGTPKWQPAPTVTGGFCGHKLLVILHYPRIHVGTYEPRLPARSGTMPSITDPDFWPILVPTQLL